MTANSPYKFQTIGRVDRLDRKVLLGLFDYPSYSEAPDGTNEIDIEFARWGNPKYPNGNFTIYPAEGKRVPEDSFTFESALPETTSSLLATHRFAHASKQVALTPFAGTGKSGDKVLAAWTYAPTGVRLIPQKPLAVRINLWLFQGKPPTHSKEVGGLLKKFTFTSAR